MFYHFKDNLFQWNVWDNIMSILILILGPDLQPFYIFALHVYERRGQWKHIFVCFFWAVFFLTMNIAFPFSHASIYVGCFAMQIYTFSYGCTRYSISFCFTISWFIKSVYHCAKQIRSLYSFQCGRLMSSSHETKTHVSLRVKQSR